MATLNFNIMTYYNSNSFANWVKRKHADFFPGIYNQNKHKIIDFKEEVVLPINEGSERWWRFTVKLNSIMVLASYEAPGFDEDPQIVGIIKNDDATSIINSKPKSSDIDVGRLYLIDTEVLNIHTLKLLPHSSEIFVSAVDTSNNLTTEIIDELKTTSGQLLNSATALIPYGANANRIASSILDEIFDEIGRPKEIGNPYYLFKVSNKQYWKRKPEDDIWHQYKFIAFVAEDPDDEDEPYEEIYLSLWELKLESEKAVMGEAVEPPPPSEDIKLKNEVKKTESSEEELKEKVPVKKTSEQKINKEEKRE
ncbi:hypothetical protein ACE1ET_00310 [Saccharicrinis sp. FJH62]|uniref:hypothetical protein n=1 Tax=Saccharicrinis sp. FJH62 TaxID=3344657 RepID=UPI0035D4B32E